MSPQFIRLFVLAFYISFIVPAVQAGQPTTKGKPVFAWKVTDPKTQKKVYLVGSVHYGKKEYYPLPDVIEKAFKGSDALAVEVIVDFESAEAVQKVKNIRRLGRIFILQWIIRAILSLFIFLWGIISLILWDFSYDLVSLGCPLAGLLIFLEIRIPFLTAWMRRSSVESELLLSVFRQLDIDKDLKIWLFLFTSPLGIYKILNEKLTRQAMGSSRLGTEQYFIPLAKKAGKPIIELEKMEDQLKMLAKLKSRPEFSTLRSFLEDFENLKKLAEQTVLAWQTGDIALLNQVKEGCSKRYIDYEKIMFTDRNMDMTKKIKDFLQGDKTIFVLIGSMHYIGEMGILALLEKEGYHIEQLYT